MCFHVCHFSNSLIPPTSRQCLRLSRPSTDWRVPPLLLTPAVHSQREIWLPMRSVGLYYKVQRVGRCVFETRTVIEKSYILWKKNWSFVVVIILALLADELIEVINSVPWLCISLILFHAVLSQAVWQSHPCLQANKANQGLSFRTSVLHFLEVSRTPWLFQEKSGFQCLGDFAAAWISWVRTNTLWGDTVGSQHAEPQNCLPRVGGCECLRLVTPVCLTPCIPEVLLSACSIWQICSLLGQKA